MPSPTTRSCRLVLGLVVGALSILSLAQALDAGVVLVASVNLLNTTTQPTLDNYLTCPTLSSNGIVPGGAEVGLPYCGDPTVSSDLADCSSQLELIKSVTRSGTEDPLLPPAPQFEINLTTSPDISEIASGIASLNLTGSTGIILALRLVTKNDIPNATDPTPSDVANYNKEQIVEIVREVRNHIPSSVVANLRVFVLLSGNLDSNPCAAGGLLHGDNATVDLASSLLAIEDVGPALFLFLTEPPASGETCGFTWAQTYLFTNPPSELPAGSENACDGSNFRPDASLAFYVPFAAMGSSSSGSPCGLQRLSSDAGV